MGVSQNNEATIQQEGNENRAAISQGSGEGPNGFDNTAADNKVVIAQKGNSNEANVLQGDTGESFSAVEAQTLESVILVSQQGNDHQANILQLGTDNLIDLQQSGVGNVAQVVQGAAFPASNSIQ